MGNNLYKRKNIEWQIKRPIKKPIKLNFKKVKDIRIIKSI